MNTERHKTGHLVVSYMVRVIAPTTRHKNAGNREFAPLDTLNRFLMSRRTI